ncbi:GTPase-associated system all-helical protein GASH [Gimesia panareensis]|uniref:GTPase-associated system all-helical protein GASH n=1 Tax=Gimesia panareensis TaxID=2527978 RepID=UPI00118A961C|nr:GTPase-associated system all-helical protein GASH [Gimesia panareensis]QDU52999.1 hypothetical protein Pan110_53810 [Gimesia panareensis]
MDIHFADWLRLADIEDCQGDGDRLQLRWSGLENSIQDISSDQILNLALLFYRLPIDDEVADEFAGFFKDEDNTFPMIDNRLYLSCLAGAALGEVIQSQPETTEARLSALAVICPNCMGKNKISAIEEIVRRSWNALHSESASLRDLTKHSLNRSSVPNISTSLNSIKENFEIQTQLPQAYAPLEKILNGLAKSIKQTNQNNKYLNSQLELFREESDILWWLTTAVSKKLSVVFEDLNWPATTVILGVELAEMVRRFPGPLSYKELLARAIQLSGKEENEMIKISSVVSKLEKEFSSELESLYSENPALSLCPLIKSLVRSRGAKRQAEWLQPLKQEFSISNTTQFNCVDFAMQIYLETLLLRQFNAIQIEGE